MLYCLRKGMQARDTESLQEGSLHRGVRLRDYPGVQRRTKRELCPESGQTVLLGPGGDMPKPASHEVRRCSGPDSEECPSRGVR